MTDDGWKLTIFSCVAIDPKDGQPIPCGIAGYVKGFFGIDPRMIMDDYEVTEKRGWVINHLPTGYAMFGVEGDLQQAKDLAEKITGAVNWNFADKSQAPDRNSLDGYLDGALSASRFLRPLWLNQEF